MRGALACPIPCWVFAVLFPAPLLPELEAAAAEAYLGGLRDAGWLGVERLVRLGMCASAVKYEWLLPMMLEKAGDDVQLDYGSEGAVAADLRYAERGATLAYLMGWVDAARRLQ